jgi:hypothetical protein
MGIDMGIGIVMGCDGYPDDVEPGGEGIGTGMATCPCPYTGFGWLVVVVAVVVVVVPFPPGPGYAGGVYVPCARAAGSVSTLSASVPGGRRRAGREMVFRSDRILACVRRRTSVALTCCSCSCREIGLGTGASSAARRCAASVLFSRAACGVSEWQRDRVAFIDVSTGLTFRYHFLACSVSLGPPMPSLTLRQTLRYSALRTGDTSLNGKNRTRTRYSLQIVAHRETPIRMTFARRLIRESPGQLLVLSKAPFGTAEKPLAQRHIRLYLSHLRREGVPLDAQLRVVCRSERGMLEDDAALVCCRGVAEVG